MKRARRRLRAAGYRGPDAELGDFGEDERKSAREVYVDAFERIIEAQLEFERLSKTADLAGVTVEREALATETTLDGGADADAAAQDFKAAEAGEDTDAAGNALARAQATAPAHAEAVANVDDGRQAHGAVDTETAEAPDADASGPAISLSEVYTVCAQYLAGVLDHYVNEAITDPGPQEAEALGGFLAHREQGGFGRFSKNANAAMTALREDLTKPLKVKAEGGFTIDMDKVEAEWRQVLAKAPFGKQGSDAIPNAYTKEQILPRIQQRCDEVRENDSFTLIFIDIDQFKRINTIHGHDAGNHVLDQFAAELRPNSSDDWLFRFGGDEFLIVSNVQGRETALDNGIRFAKRLRKGVRRKRFLVDRSKTITDRLTISCGVTDSDSDRDTPHDLLTRADRACRDAKQKGGDAVCHRSFDSRE